MQVNFREIWYNYRSEVVFFLILSVCVALSHWLSHYIPTELFDDVLAPLTSHRYLCRSSIASGLYPDIRFRPFPAIAHLAAGFIEKRIFLAYLKKKLYLCALFLCKGLTRDFAGFVNEG